MKAKIFFAWYDFWIGAYWDRRARVLYVCPVPCVVVRMERCPVPDLFAPATPAALAWPAWLAFAALVMAVGLVELAIGVIGRIATRARWIVGGMLCDVGGAALPPMLTPQRLASGPFTGAYGAQAAGVASTRWRVVRCPRGSYAVLSDREPGPVMDSRGGLHGWTETSVPDGVTFEEACYAAARCNGKPSTTNMGPQNAAERGEP